MREDREDQQHTHLAQEPISDSFSHPIPMGKTFESNMPQRETFHSELINE